MKLPESATVKDYKELSAKLRRIRRAELLKPAKRRDRELIDECEQTLVYCNQRILELGGNISKSNVALGSGRLKWAVAIATVIAIILATGVAAYAAGRKALSDQVQWNVRRIKVENADDFWNRVETDIPRDELDMHTFSSESELRSEYGEDLLLPGSFKAVYFVSATAYGQPGNALIRCEYRVNGKQLILEIDSFREEDIEYYSEGSIHYPEDFKTVNTSTMFIGEGTDCSFAYFFKGNNQYILTGGQGSDVIADIAWRMIKMGRSN